MITLAMEPDFHEVEIAVRDMNRTIKQFQTHSVSRQEFAAFYMKMINAVGVLGSGMNAIRERLSVEAEKENG